MRQEIRNVLEVGNDVTLKGYSTKGMCNRREVVIGGY